MKMAYEKPMVRAELYQTNAYCSVCTSGVPVLTTDISTSENGSWFSPVLGPSWGDNKQTLLSAGWDLSHTFNQGKAETMVSQATGHVGQTQYYWVCDCPDCAEKGEHYLLEYSAQWSSDTRYKDQNIFVLYKDTTGDQKLQVNWGNGGWLPDNPARNEDQGLGATFVDFSTRVIDNS
ncbi:MAG: hypothetical protein E7321_00580 [Clostridiales bacterium]|nr:hypothetical protein [Clostridiales bacterium]